MSVVLQALASQPLLLLPLAQSQGLDHRERPPLGLLHQQTPLEAALLLLQAKQASPDFQRQSKRCASDFYPYPNMLSCHVLEAECSAPPNGMSFLCGMRFKRQALRF